MDRLTVHIKVSAQQVHGLAELVQVNKGSNDNQGTQYIPQPAGRSTKAVADPAAGQLPADTGGNSVVPYDGTDTQRDGGNDKGQQAEVHGLFAIVAAGNQVDVSGNSGVEYKCVDAEGDQGQQNELDKAAFGFQLQDGRCACGLFRHSWYLSSSINYCIDKIDNFTVKKYAA